MAISYKEIRKPRQWKATTGLSESQFHILSKSYGNAYRGIYGMELWERQANSTVEAKLKSYEAVVFFLLFSFKNGLSYDSLGLVFDMDGSTAKQNQSSGLVVLRKALIDLGNYPARDFKTAKEFEQAFEGEDILIVDCTEQAIQRPDNQEVQKECYSGKKKRHTVKSLVISNMKKAILYISEGFVGSFHDYKLLQYKFPPEQDWFRLKKVLIDLGFQGFLTIYKTAECEIPNKKPKGKELSEDKKKENKKFASVRVLVENAIGGVKRYRILQDRLRVRNFNFYDEVLGICAGLWNFCLTH